MNINDYLIYGFNFIKEDNSYSIIANDDIGGATSANDLESSMYMAKWFVLDTADFKYRDMQLMPKALPLQQGMIEVNIGIDCALKIMLRNLMLETRTKQAKLAKLMGITPQALTKIMLFDKTTKIETLAKAFEAMGKPLKIEC